MNGPYAVGIRVFYLGRRLMELNSAGGDMSCLAEIILTLVNLKDCPGLVLRNSLNFSGRMRKNFI